MGNERLQPTSTNPLSRLLVFGVIVVSLGGGGAYLWYRMPKPNEATKPPDIGPALTRQSTASRVPNVRFTDVTKQAGIHFRHTNGATDKKLLPETMGSGVAFLDFDGD